MLILSRQRNEAIMIGDDFETVIDLSSGREVYLSIIVPAKITVRRKFETVNPPPGNRFLSLRTDETATIGDDGIEIMIIAIRGGKGVEKIRIGIVAPPHIPVHRKEIYEMIRRGKLAARSPLSKGESDSH